MGTDPVPIALALHQCGEVDRGKTAVRNEFVSYKLPTGKFHGFSKSVVQAKNRVRDVYWFRRQ